MRGCYWLSITRVLYSVAYFRHHRFCCYWLSITRVLYSAQSSFAGARGCYWLSITRVLYWRCYKGVQPSVAIGSQSPECYICHVARCCFGLKKSELLVADWAFGAFAEMANRPKLPVSDMQNFDISIFRNLFFNLLTN